MSSYNSPLLDSLRAIADETKTFISALSKVEDNDVPPAKEFMFKLTSLMVHRPGLVNRMIDRGKVMSNDFPDRDLLTDEIRGNMLNTPTATHLSAYIGYIREVADELWKAREEVDHLRKESEVLLPAIKEAFSRLSDNQPDLLNGDSSNALLLSCMPFGIQLLESLQINLPSHYWMILTNILDSVEPAPGIAGKDEDSKRDRWAGKRNNYHDDRMSLEEVEKWFMQLAEKGGKRGEPFLTKEEVCQFIQQAFVKCVPFDEAEKLTLNKAEGSKGEIVDIFHSFFCECTRYRHNVGLIDPKGTAHEYKLLLSNYFSNWTYDQIKDNFRHKKPGKRG